MNWFGKQILITGAAGFIGSHLAECLVQKGANVRAFVRYNSQNDIGALKFLPATIRSEIEIIAGDLRDCSAIHSAVSGTDTLFHLGALIAIPYSYIHPRDVIETNIMGTLNVLTSARTLGVRRVVHTSTSEVYGSAKYTPIDEGHPLKGQSPYSASKIGADKIAESFFRSFNVPVATLRPFNTYGPRQSGRAVIPSIIAQTLINDEIKLGSLTTRRDFTYIDDTINGFLKIASVDNVVGEEINIGNGSTISINDLSILIFKIINKKPNILTDTKRIRPENSEVLQLFASIEKAKRILTWTPQINLEKGLTDTIEWISKNMRYYQPDQYLI